MTTCSDCSASAPETHAPSLGNLVGEQWRNEPDTLGRRHAHHRDSTILGFIADGLTERPGHGGCSTSGARTAITSS